MSKCSDYKLIVYLDGTQVREDTGCVGDQHTYTTSTTLPSDTTYKWYIDSIVPPSPLVGTNSSYTYTFDSKDHVIYVVATSLSAGCAIQVTVDAESVDCPPQCEIDCVRETVSFQPGKFTGLVDKFNNVYHIPPSFTFECAKTSVKNDTIVKWIKTMLKSQPNCSNTDIVVAWTFNKLGTNCIELIITNSPIKFTTITVGNKNYSFNTSLC